MPGQEIFIAGIDPLIEKNLGSSQQDTGMASRLKKRSTSLASIQDLERAWSDWTARWVKGKR